MTHWIQRDTISRCQACPKNITRDYYLINSGHLSLISKKTTCLRISSIEHIIKTFLIGIAQFWAIIHFIYLKGVCIIRSIGWFESGWRHQMESFYAVLVLCEVTHPINGGFPFNFNFQFQFRLLTHNTNVSTTTTTDSIHTSNATPFCKYSAPPIYHGKFSPKSHKGHPYLACKSR